MKKDEIRERLVELISKTPCIGDESKTAAEHVADHLVAHGVTIKRWIPVSERLPKPMENPVLAVFMGTVFPAWYHGGKWEVPSGFLSLTSPTGCRFPNRRRRMTMTDAEKLKLIKRIALNLSPLDFGDERVAQGASYAMCVAIDCIADFDGGEDDD